ncbi:FtsK/SpoIIIE domain-containing protein [Sinomonas atrocyanea]|uniref:FtsK/SpoIIIE domain-containing protein n=1 Tax=Sinomonas atrocyanea TaxID=37927 RepID=UPI002861F9CB|nr:FtsK/SpoIIIE domain-containing protein [Sinomonas atrocyanea]MDR6621770.1 S-DNA-T family DNA segregation ATPase FtsK/SpoIIIE [Sinomonas atrocyanea]
MRIRLTLRRDPEPAVDLAVTVDGLASVGDVARELWLADPARAAEHQGAGRAGAEAGALAGLTLRVEESVLAGGMTGRVLDPEGTFLESGLRQGSTVSLSRVAVRGASDRAAGHGAPGPDSGGRVTAVDRGPAAATLRVVSGPDAGKEFSLPVGASLIGRGAGADVALGDPLVSKRHARITVGETIEIADLNSSNGLVMDGLTVSKAVLSSSDAVTLGDSTVSVVGLGHSAGRTQTSPLVPFNRSPRVVPRFPPQARELPEGPQRPTTQPFPIVMLFVPVLMGAVMFMVLQSVVSIVFMAMMPLFAVGMWFEYRRHARRELREETRLFEERLAEFGRQITELQTVERAVRLQEAPSVAETVESIYRLGPLLWTHAPEHREFLTVRLGLGTVPSRVSVTVPPEGRTLPEFTRRLHEAQGRFAVLDAVPVTASLRQGGGLGVAGPRGLVENVARGILLQIAGLHSPAEVVIAGLASHGSKERWEWLQWLPHVGSSHSPLTGDHLAAGSAAGMLLLTRLEDLLAVRTAGPDGQGGPGGAAGRRGAVREEQDGTSEPIVPTVVVLVEDDAPVDRGRLTRIAELGPDVGLHVVWVAAGAEQLPQCCRDFIVVDGEHGATSGQVRLGRHTYPVSCESVDEALAVQLGRMLTPIVDVGKPVDDDSDLPRSVSYVTLAGAEIADDAGTVAERWQQSNSVRASAVANPKAKGTLRALVGSKGVEQFFLDLKNEGPHALVGGTTGAGKSEFLQSWVLGMASAYSPDRVTFLFVDYKGGAAFADCVSLPHTVGLVTDLSPHLVRRALTSLRAELHYREHLFNRKKAKDLLAMERAADPDTPPYLVIVVDEFAALATEVPEFVEGVVDVAARGRSLGLHLILATQRPAGVIRDSLRANTNLRIALRMADEADSEDILGEKTAAYFDPGIPGRGAAKTGPGRIQGFQTGYASGWTTERPALPRIDIAEMDFGTGAAWERPADLVDAEPEAEGPNDIARMVRTISTAADRIGLEMPRKPWLAELPQTYDVARLPNPRTDERLLLGVVDDPAHQSQPTFSYEPDRDGNMAVYGTGGSGKSAALRTVAVAAAITMRGGPVQVYGIDAGSRGLHMLEALPHVGAVIDGDDAERVGRLMRRLSGLVDERSERYAAARAGSIGEYRRLADRPDEPRIIVLIDGMGAFREQYEYSSDSPVFDLLTQLASDGRAVGVHLVMTGDRTNSIPASIASSVQKRIILRMTGEDDYLMFGQPKDVVTPQSPPGRGVVDGLEVQLGVLGGNANVALQAREITRLAEAMRRQGVPEAPPVRTLPDLVAGSALPTDSGRVALGLEDSLLEPLYVDPSGAFMLTGPPGSGRTTALAALAAGLRRARPGVRRVYLGARRSALANLPLWDASFTGEDAVSAAVDELQLDVGVREFALFIEGLPEFDSTLAESGLSALITAMDREGLWVVGESETAGWGSAWSLSQPFKNGRRGLLLNPAEMDGDSLLNTSLGRIRNPRYVPGRGFYVARGRAYKVQAAFEDLSAG